MDVFVNILFSEEQDIPSHFGSAIQGSPACVKSI